MDVLIKEVSDRKDLKTFIYLPEKLHRQRELWVPTIYADEWAYFSHKKNTSFSFSDTVLYLAVKEDLPVGRVMGIINRKHNELRNQKTARFCYLEATEDKAVVSALLGAVEKWAKEKGATRIIGPYGFTDQDPEGFMISGFEHGVTIASYYNMEWMPAMLEEQGYGKDIDYMVYRLKIPETIPAFYSKIYERVNRKGHYEIIEFRKRKDIKPWIKPVLHLMNECYIESEIYGYSPLSEKEMEELASRYLPVLDPRFIKVVKNEDGVIAFIIGMPDMTAGIRKARGKLWPFGFLKIMRAAKTTQQLDLLLGAIKPQYRGRGLDVLMGVKVLQSAHEAGYKIIDTHHEMESNVRVRGEMERMGGEVYKKYRVYQKDL
jgi:hypothetical protein